ncbi:thermonuclease family protein [Mycoplasmopsis verecunda]|nr:thermonuclease family protein [Mycoplasmopsis verecunda]WPB54757.1 thermonuclease family protein [Mycoplasmopsis verecunda]
MPISLISLSAMAISCKTIEDDNTRANKFLGKEVKELKLNYVNGINTPFNVEFKSNERFKVKNGEIVPARNLPANSKLAFNRRLSDLVKNISDEFLKSDSINIKYTKPTNEDKDYLLTPNKYFSNIPKYFKVNVKQSNGSEFELLYVLSNFAQSFENWKDGLELGVNNPTEKDQKKALDLANLTAINSFVYLPYTNENVSIKDLTVNISIKTNQTIDPLLKNYNTKFDTSIFEKSNIDWSKVPTDQYFDGYIGKVSDGDTFSVILREDKQTINGLYKKGANPLSSHDKKRDNMQEPYIRLQGIDTPEKAVSEKLSPPFEYAFALMPTHFAEALWNKDNGFSQNVRVAFLEKDAYGRTVADVFFGDDYQYSYNTEIVRAGFTLPMSSNNVQHDGNNVHSIPGSYIDLFYEKIAIAMFQAMENRRGFFHYFEKPSQLSDFVYMAKKNTQWVTFWNIYQNWLKKQDK